MKNLISFFVAMFLICVGFFSQTAFASDHPSCVINKAGVFPSLENPVISRSGFPVFMSCEGSLETMYFLSSDMGNAGIATVLTAIALNKTVWARTTTDAPGGLITVIYLSQ